MALYNEILVGRYNRFLQKLFGLKGGPPAPQLGSEITPSFAMFSGVENRYIEQWNRYCITVGVLAGGAGIASGIRFRNPAGSNIVAVVEKMMFMNNSGTVEITGTYGNITTDLTSIFGPAPPLDNRQQTTDAVCRVSRQNAGALPSFGGQFADLFLGTGNVDYILTEDQQIAVPPGAGMQWATVALNVAINSIMLLWRERFLEDSERA